MIGTYSRIAVLAGLAVFTTHAALAAATDYEFQPVSVEIKNDAGSELGVRLVDKRTGKAVPGAVIFRTQLDMSPDGMGEMLAKHEALPPGEPGVYRYKADITMAGDWAFKLQAKVPGEAETVEGSVVFTAKD
ncbi:FixH family protein [Hyphomicrobium sp.]|uniref:FixH family protein n=1 Tax=Hyphomicrobium sp. TaxID=82 RepID=UPI002E2FC011|nr:FixH family protein [Hyphomicrobium sp.]HEX2842173.1 FixH family protein [Hyphomicrobium sp.]